ncbi:MAG: SUF system Fe-S cluster assembly regulator [Pseudomonadota bacterium]
MLRIGKLTDYGTLILTRMTGGDCVSATELAEQTRLGPPTAAKILKALARAGIVRSVRGAHGGYALARPATDISAAQIIDALEGPVAITECATGAGSCELESLCGVGNAWQHINVAIRQSLDAISLAQLADWQPGTLPSLNLNAEAPASNGEASAPSQTHEYTSNA